MVRLSKGLFAAALANIGDGFLRDNLFPVPSAFVEHHLTKTRHISQPSAESAARIGHSFTIYLIVSRLRHAQLAPYPFGKHFVHRFSGHFWPDPAQRVGIDRAVTKSVAVFTIFL